MERVIHKPLECGGGVSHTEEHHHRFEEAFVSKEGTFPLVAILDTYVVITPTNVELGEEFGLFQFIYEVSDERERVGIMDGMLVEIPVILTGAEFSILLLDKEERRGLRGFRRSDFACLEVFINEGVSGLDLIWREWVKFTNLRIERLIAWS